MMRALLADTDAGRRDLMATVLTREGLAVVTAADVAQALAWLAAGELAVAVCEEELPGGGAIELARAARVAAPGLRLVLLQREGAGATVTPGFDAVLRAPFRDHELRRHLVSWGMLGEVPLGPPAAAGLSYRLPPAATFAFALPPPPAPPDRLAPLHASAAGPGASPPRPGRPRLPPAGRRSGWRDPR